MAELREHTLPLCSVSVCVLRSPMLVRGPDGITIAHVRAFGAETAGDVVESAGMERPSEGLMGAKC